MNAFVVCLSLLLAGVVAPASAQTIPSSSNDRVYTLVGTWNCQSALGSFGTVTYTHPNGNTVVMVDKFMAPTGELGEFDESYTADAAGSQWTWSSNYVSHPGYSQAGTAAPWTGNTWTLSGTLTVKETTGEVLKLPTRMVYTRWNNNMFQRDIDVQAHGDWARSSSSVCKRTS